MHASDSNMAHGCRHTWPAQQLRLAALHPPCAIHDWMTLRECSGCRSRQTSSSRRLRLRICFVLIGRKQRHSVQLVQMVCSAAMPKKRANTAGCTPRRRLRRPPPLTSCAPPPPGRWSAASAAALHATRSPPRARGEGWQARGAGPAVSRGSSVTTRRAAGQAAAWRASSRVAMSGNVLGLARQPLCTDLTSELAPICKTRGQVLPGRASFVRQHFIRGVRLPCTG